MLLWDIPLTTTSNSSLFVKGLEESAKAEINPLYIAAIKSDSTHNIPDTFKIVSIPFTYLYI
jgi:hypothetical protein